MASAVNVFLAPGAMDDAKNVIASLTKLDRFFDGGSLMNEI